MASLSYANAGSGPASGGIGWFDWGTLTINPGQTITNQTATFRDGSTVTLDLTCTSISGGGIPFDSATIPIFAGSPFGTSGYTGVSGYVALYNNLTGTIESTQLTLSNISVKDKFGNPITAYTVVLADAETTGTNETQVHTTNGSNWSLLDTVGGTIAPIVSGLGTTIVTFSGVSTIAPSAPVIITNSPTIISSILTEGGGGKEGVAYGFTLSTVQLGKSITNRFSSLDQFSLNIAGTPSSTTITTGAIYGAQNEIAQIFTTSSNNYTINESMAAGSASNLSQYSQVVTATNLTPGGTPVPVSLALGTVFPVTLGDSFLVTITNAIIPPTITSTKTANNFIGNNQQVTYIVPVKNNGSVTINNVVITDTLPSGTTFVSGSATLNGVSIAGNPSPPGGINIGAISPGAISTLSFRVLVSTTLTNPSPLTNSATVNFGFNALPTNLTNSGNSNTTTTTIVTSSLSSSKIVDINYADIGSVLTYTIPITNLGNTTINNVIFSDTLPTGLTFVPSSLTQNGNPMIGSPNPPGVLLNDIGPGSTTTMSFRATVNTIPTSNSILNSATTTFSYTIDPTTSPIVTGNNGASSNIVLTTINNARLSPVSKSVSKAYASCGETLIYTITIPNSGSVTATNVVFTDTIPNGTTLVPNSVTVNGATQAGVNPGTGVTVGTISAGASAVVTFSVTVNC